MSRVGYSPHFWAKRKGKGLTPFGGAAGMFAKDRCDAVINPADLPVYLSVCFGPDAA